MPLRWRMAGQHSFRNSCCSEASLRSRWITFALLVVLVGLADAMTKKRVTELRQETVDMFYHGFDNYMNVAFPEDELRPVSCVPLTRDRLNPNHVELNDVLGNYSLTLIDSLSTLAILASAPADEAGTGPKALRDFQNGVAALVTQYGDGTEGPSGKGLRARGFDVDSKVQVFETVIRGVGGLLSAHLFASGELPIKGYKPRRAPRRFWKSTERDIHPPIAWQTGFKYDGQLLRLALDLAQRLLPAFYTNTGMPYPRVNLRHGVPFYENSPLNQKPEGEAPPSVGPKEITETCSAGAGSLVLEFTVLSRLSGDPRFEQLAKRAFWSVWSRRSNIGLIGAGVDAEVGHWVGPYAGIGAGADSFFEYALKTHILLSGHDSPNSTVPNVKRNALWMDPNTMYRPLTDEENSSDSFLYAWKDAHAAIKRHLYSGTHHPHYVNAHLSTGSPQAFWIDSLGAYYPGLLTLAGELDEAVETNLLYTALWTRYAALPERWSVLHGGIEGGLGWWPGRPEFIESNYHIYRATKDPWYLYVGEMVLKDIKRRCWTECGWAGLQDVRTGEKSDRMESFFLGETAKYLYLLFDSEHPLNSMDAPYVFTTEGHPLIIPRKSDVQRKDKKFSRATTALPHHSAENANSCPVPPALLPFTISATAARSDIFHASSLTALHTVPNHHALGPTKVDIEDDEFGQSVVPNHTFYPWTLPMNLVPLNASCAALPTQKTFTIEFPASHQFPTPPGANVVLGPQGLIRVNEGIIVKALPGVKLGMVQETPPGKAVPHFWRIWNIGNMALGRDEKVFISREVMGPMSDPSFTRIRDPVMIDLVLQIPNPIETNHTSSPILAEDESLHMSSHDRPELHFEDRLDSGGMAVEMQTMLSSLLQHVTSALRDPVATLLPEPLVPPTFQTLLLPAVTPTGLGAAPVPDIAEAPDPTIPSVMALTFKSFFFADQACTSKLPDDAVRNHNVIVMRRGGCSFVEKLANIPAYSPSTRGFKLLIIVSEDEDEEGNPIAHENGYDDGSRLIRPLLDQLQRTPSGLLRNHPVAMVMVGGGEATIAALRKVKSVGIRRRYHVESQGLVIGNLIVI